MNLADENVVCQCVLYLNIFQVGLGQCIYMDTDELC